MDRRCLSTDEASDDPPQLEMSVEVKEEVVGAGPSSETPDGKSIWRGNHSEQLQMSSKNTSGG